MNRNAVLMALGCVLMWSTVASAFKLTLSLISPLQMLWLAVATSCGILLLAATAQKKLTLARTYLREHFGYFLLLALLNPTAYYLILFAAYDMLPAQQAQALNYTWAIMLSIGFLWADFHFYAYHRILHEVDSLYKSVHKIHHESVLIDWVIFFSTPATILCDDLAARWCK